MEQKIRRSIILTALCGTVLMMLSGLCIAYIFCERKGVSFSDLFGGAILPLVLCALALMIATVVTGSAAARFLVRPIITMESGGESIGKDIPYPELQPFVDAVAHDRAMRLLHEDMRREFTDNISHELKTPLTSISGYAELMEQGLCRGEDVTQFAAKIHKEAGRLLLLVNDILQLSRLDTQARSSIQVKFEPLDIYDVLCDCADALAMNAQHAYVTLLTQGTHIRIRGDRAGLYDLCTNLCVNAIRYNRPGGKVVLSCGMDGEHPYLRVRDTGIGIPHDAQEHVFERFYRVDKSRSKETGGTGLGLAIVKHIATLHDARIDLKSKEGEGTDIRVLFASGRKV